VIDERSINELDSLLSRLCDGTISAEDAAQLDTVLSADVAARQTYNNYMFLHAELYAQHASLEAVADGGNRGLWIADCGLTEGDVDAVISPKSVPPRREIGNHFPHGLLPLRCCSSRLSAAG
jgi:hypothetical protein